MRLLSSVLNLRKWIRSSIRRRLILLSTVLWVVSASALALVLIFTGQARMISDANERNKQLASTVSRNINAQIASISSDVRAVAAHLEQIAPDLETQAGALVALRLASPQRYRAAYYFDESGDLLMRVDDPVAQLPHIPVGVMMSRGADPADDLVTSAFWGSRDSFYVSKIVFAPTDRSPLLYVGLPVRVPNSDSRVAIFKVDLSDIWQSIDSMTLGSSGIAYLVAPDGTIIAHPDKAYIGRPIPSEVIPLLSVKEGYGQYIEPFRKVPVLAAFSPVGGQTGWGAVIQQDRLEAYAGISDTVVTSVVVWTVLAALGTISIYVLMRNFTRPIVELTKTAEDIASTGQLTRTSMSSNEDEVGHLSQAFDAMMWRLETAQGALVDARGDLENRVVQRTAELSDTNEALLNEIKQRVQVEEALRESELKYRHLVQNATTMILEMDTHGRVTFFNQFAEEFFGFVEAEILGKSVVGTIVPEKDSSGKDLEAMIAAIVKNPDEFRHNENENVKKSGERVWVVWSNQPLYDEQQHLRGILCVGIDMTEQRKAEAILDEQSREQAAAEERTRLARDLHDAVSQTLFSASIIADVLPRIWEKNPEEGRARLAEVRQLTRGALAEMRTLLFELRPAQLADAELSDLLKQLAESVTGRARVPVSTSIEGRCKIPPDTKIGLYRIAQEALNNIAKHSEAESARVTMKASDESVELRIKDDGTGFDVTKATGKSLGLGIMRERAAAIGASLEIKTAAGEGTEVIVEWRSPS